MNKILYVKKVFKYLNDYKYSDKINKWYIKHPKMSRYAKFFDKIKQIIFLTKDVKLLKAYNKSWEKVGSLIKTDLILNQCIAKNN